MTKSDVDSCLFLPFVNMLLFIKNCKVFYSIVIDFMLRFEIIYSILNL